MEKQSIYDLVIVGGGIVGLSTAYQIKKKNKSLRIAVIDKEIEINKHQTGRNSGVIHSGIYYKENSYKAKNCLDGYSQLLNFLNEFKIPYKITGKAIIATDESELARLDTLFESGINKGLKLEKIDGNAINKIHNGLNGISGIWVSETGLTDYKEVNLTFLEEFTRMGGKTYFGSVITEVRHTSSSMVLQTSNGVIETAFVINAAGLGSDRVYTLITGKVSPIRIIPFKGEYFKLKKDSYSSEIPIYPVPNPDFPFLGIHITRMIDGTVKVGPNAVLSLDREGYNGFSVNGKDMFDIFTSIGLFKTGIKYGHIAVQELIKQTNKTYYTKMVQKYWPEFNWNMVDGYTCGIRAQALNRDGLVDDFVYETDNRSIHILNAPSPAATSCLSIGNQVASIYSKLISN